MCVPFLTRNCVYILDLSSSSPPRSTTAKVCTWPCAVPWRGKGSNVRALVFKDLFVTCPGVLSLRRQRAAGLNTQK